MAGNSGQRRLGEDSAAGSGDSGKTRPPVGGKGGRMMVMVIRMGLGRWGMKVSCRRR